MNSKKEDDPNNSEPDQDQDKTRVDQKVESVSAGGTVVGNVQAGSDGTLNIGGDHRHGATYEPGSQHSERFVDTGGAPFIENLQQMASAGRISNRQAPAPPRNYIAREQVEQRIITHLKEAKNASQADGKTTIVCLVGVHQLGKTTVAAHIAHELIDEFQDGTLWADLSISNRQEMLLKFLYPFNPDYLISEASSAREHLAELGRQLQEKQVLIVLDNVSNSDEIRELIPTDCPGVVVLAISQLRLPDLLNVHSTVQMSELLPDEARKWFRTIWGQNNLHAHVPDKVVFDLAEAARYSPAYIVAIARDIILKQITPSAYLANYIEPKRASGSKYLTSGPMDTVYESLPSPARELLPFIGVFKSYTWPADALRFVSQRSLSDVYTGLRQLTERSLLQIESPGMFRAGPVYAGFAYEKLAGNYNKSLVHMAQTLAAHYFLNTAEQTVTREKERILSSFLRDDVCRRAYIERMLDAARDTQITQPIIRIEGINTDLPLTINVDFGWDLFEQILFTRESPTERHLADSINQAFGILRMLPSPTRDTIPLLLHSLNWSVDQQDWAAVRRFGRCAFSYWNNGELVRGQTVRGSGQFYDESDFEIWARHIWNDIESTSIRNATLITDSVWNECKVFNTTWFGVHMRRCVLNDVDMVGIVAPGLMVSESVFNEVDLRHADLRGALFLNCRLSEVNLRGANLYGAHFIDCSFDNVDIRGGVSTLDPDTIVDVVLNHVVLAGGSQLFLGDYEEKFFGSLSSDNAYERKVKQYGLRMELDEEFSDLHSFVDELPPEYAVNAQNLVRQLQMEAVMGDSADDAQMAHILLNLVKEFPETGSKAATVFANQKLQKSIGPMTKSVLKGLDLAV